MYRFLSWLKSNVSDICLLLPWSQQQTVVAVGDTVVFSTKTMFYILLVYKPEVYECVVGKGSNGSVGRCFLVKLSAQILVALLFSHCLSLSLSITLFCTVSLSLSPEFVPFFCSLVSLGCWVQHSCIFVHKSCTLNTIQLLTKLILWWFFSRITIHCKERALPWYCFRPSHCSNIVVLLSFILSPLSPPHNVLSLYWATVTL